MNLDQAISALMKTAIAPRSRVGNEKDVAQAALIALKAKREQEKAHDASRTAQTRIQ